jgi:hypothetical protein
MFLRTMATMTLFSAILPAADDIFTIRSFHQPETKAELPMTGALLTPESAKRVLTQALQEQPQQCAIPLLQAKPGKVHDNMTQFAGPNPDRASIMPPPLPTCKNWK